LATGEERHAGHGGRHGPPQTPQVGVGHLVDSVLGGAGRSWEHHVGLEDHGLQDHPLVDQVGEYSPEDGLGHCLAAFQGVVAGHQHFGLDHRHQPSFLAGRRVTG
jgi:hypothetical protein